MEQETVSFLASEQVQHLSGMAEQARAALSRFAGYEVAYDSVALQLLDEWIDRHVRQFPKPSPKITLLWTSFLGEMFCRRHQGKWVFSSPGKANELAVLCPAMGGDRQIVQVSDQIGRRIAEGISASLVYFYTMTSIGLKAGQ